MNKNKGWRMLVLLAGGLVSICMLMVCVLMLWLWNLLPSPALSGSDYFVRDGRIYFKQGWPNEPFVVSQADVGSFALVTGDPHYARDRSHVYAYGKIIPGADPATFQMLGSIDWGKDKQHVYHRTSQVSDDPAHFEILNRNFSRDNYHVYNGTSVLSDDPTHFVIISDNTDYTYARDSKIVYINGKPIANANPATFRVLANAYTRDDRNVFYFDQLIVSVDPATFQVVESPYARDAQRVYWMGRTIPDANPQSFRVLNAKFECSADAQRAYYRDRVIAKVDPQTIPANRPVIGCTDRDISFAP